MRLIGELAVEPREELVAREVDLRLVERGVRRVPLLVRDRLDRRDVAPSQVGDLLVRGGVDRDVRRVELEREPHLVALEQRLRRHGRDEVAAARLDAQEALGDETRQRVVHRASRHAELRRELVQAELRAGAGVAGQDPLAERRVDLVVEVRPRRQDGHGRDVT